MGTKKPELRSINEAKIIVIGEGDVGKTSLINRLVFGTFDQNQEKTKGIKIQKWPVKINHQSFVLNIWDFGGQEITHSTHQFFLTQRSLYILAFATRVREEENRIIEYWVKIIRAFGGEQAPIILVGNKSDQNRLEVNEPRLRAKYPNIRRIIKTSCLSGEGIDELKLAIFQETLNLPHVYEKIPTNWFTIKDNLAKTKKDYISYEKYAGVCNSKGVTDEHDQVTLLKLLNDLGVALNFHEDPLLHGTSVLSPAWVTNGVYGILNSNELFNAKGVLDADQISEILDSHEYPSDKISFILGVMKKFELCFEFEDNAKRKYLVPALLQYDEPYSGEWDNALKFEFHYDVLPASIISRLITRLQPYVNQNTVWRHGILIDYEGSQILVKADYTTRRITIEIKGNSRRDALSAIRSQLKSIHATIRDLKYKEMVTVPDHPEAEAIEYSLLVQLERENIKKYPVKAEEQIIDINVSDVLNGIENRDEAPVKDGLYTNALIFVVIATFVFACFLTIVGIMLAASASVPWYGMLLAPLTGLLAIVIVTAVGLLIVGKLDKKNFVEIIVTSTKQLPIFGKFIPENIFRK